MQTSVVVILSSEEARDLLCNFWASTAVNDYPALLDAIRKGEEMHPKITSISDQRVAELIGELNLGEIVAVRASTDLQRVDKVMVNYTVQVLGNPLEINECVWNIENVPPNRRDWVYAQSYPGPQVTCPNNYPN